METTVGDEDFNQVKIFVNSMAKSQATEEDRVELFNGATTTSLVDDPDSSNASKTAKQNYRNAFQEAYIDLIPLQRHSDVGEESASIVKSFRESTKPEDWDRAAQALLDMKSRLQKSFDQHPDPGIWRMLAWIECAKHNE